MRRVAILAAGLLSMVTVLAPKQGHACSDGTNDLDRVISKDMVCWRGFIDWQFNQFQMRDWDDWGLEEPCNRNLPYNKMLTASWLIAYALPHDMVRPSTGGFGLGLQFHGWEDYHLLTSANGGSFHDGLYYTKGDIPAQADFHEWRIKFGCAPFDNNAGAVDQWGTSIMSNPVNRAGNMVHESMHAWRHTIGVKPADEDEDSSGHSKPGAAAGRCKGACDYWYRHDPSAFDYGMMWVRDVSVSPPKTHSVTQAQIEYACDLDLYSSNTPAQLSENARYIANLYMNQRIINLPSFRCDLPRFFSATKSCSADWECAGTVNPVCIFPPDGGSLGGCGPS